MDIYTILLTEFSSKVLFLIILTLELTKGIKYSVNKDQFSRQLSDTLIMTNFDTLLLSSTKQKSVI